MSADVQSDVQSAILDVQPNEATFFRNDPNWTQTFVNGSAVALLAFLFLLNLTQVLSMLS